MVAKRRSGFETPWLADRVDDHGMVDSNRYSNVTGLQALSHAWPDAEK